MSFRGSNLIALTIVMEGQGWFDLGCMTSWNLYFWKWQHKILGRVYKYVNKAISFSIHILLKSYLYTWKYFCCLFSVHNTISLSSDKQVSLIRLRFKRYFYLYHSKHLYLLFFFSMEIICRQKEHNWLAHWFQNR